MNAALQSAVLAIARDAGDAILAVYRSADAPGATGLAVQRKSDDSPLTQADLAAHRCIAAGLRALTPDAPVVSEEDPDSFVHRTEQGRFWLIDPLDGTKEFIARNGEFTVNIAWIDAGQTRWGVVYAPAVDELYWGGAGVGAWCAQQGKTSALKVTGSETVVRSPRSLTDVRRPLRVLASKSHLNADTSAYIAALGHTELVQAGSSLKFCRIAAGAADVYPRVGPTCEWDTAAAQAVLEGAGGHVCELDWVDGQLQAFPARPLRYGKSDVYNPHFVAWG